MSKFNQKFRTSSRIKPIGIPKTSQEKFEKLKSINPNIEKLKNSFDLDIDL